jgi:hypothetical protein
MSDNKLISELDPIEIANMASEIWRLKYLKARDELKAAVLEEREACAKTCEELVRGLAAPYDDTIVSVGQGCADVIRMRGEK